MEELAEQQHQTKGLLSLWLVILVFALPMLLGWFLYLNPELLAGSQKVHGKLIDPPRSMSTVVLERPDSSELKMQDLQGQWVLMLAVKGECRELCRRGLENLRKIQLGVGRDQSRIQRLLLMDRPESASMLSASDNELTSTTRVYESNQGKPLLSSVLSLLERSDEMGIFVVDPMGNLMLGYSADTPAKSIFSDMKRLLSVTKNWNGGCAVCPSIN